MRSVRRDVIETDYFVWGSGCFVNFKYNTKRKLLVFKKHFRMVVEDRVTSTSTLENEAVRFLETKPETVLQMKMHLKN